MKNQSHFSLDPATWPADPDEVRPDTPLFPDGGVHARHVSTEHLCELAADRASLLRVYDPFLDATALRDPNLRCGVAYFAGENPADFGEHRDLVMDALAQHHARPLGNGEASFEPGLPFAYCVLFDDAANGLAGEEAVEEVMEEWKRREPNRDRNSAGDEPD